MIQARGQARMISIFLLKVLLCLSMLLLNAVGERKRQMLLWYARMQCNLPSINPLNKAAKKGLEKQVKVFLQAL